MKLCPQLDNVISDKYSDELKEIANRMLEQSAEKRATIYQIMAEPLILIALLDVSCDLGSIDCPNIIPVPTRNLVPSEINITGRTSQQPNNSCLVYWWGNGVCQPAVLPLPSNDTLLTQICIGRTQKVAVTSTGKLFVWEQCGERSYIPRLVDGESAVCIKSVACGDLFMAFLTDRGLLMTSGGGASGCLGHGDYADVEQAKIVQSLLGSEVIHIACGSNHCVAVTSDNEVYCWGRSDNGRLGLKRTSSVNRPLLATIPQNYKPVQAFCSSDCSVLLTDDGSILATGSNRHNKLCLDSLFSDKVDEADYFREQGCGLKGFFLRINS